VKSELIATKGVSANNYKVVSERGNIYLMGLVTVEEGNRGAEIASQVPGVEKVVKVFQYIKPQDVQALQAAAPANGASGAQAGAAPADAATVGAVPDASVQATPLQPPAPISNSSNVHPGNPKATPQ
jgi:hypothetical protein